MPRWRLLKNFSRHRPQKPVNIHWPLQQQTLRLLLLPLLRSSSRERKRRLKMAPKRDFWPASLNVANNNRKPLPLPLLLWPLQPPPPPLPLNDTVITTYYTIDTLLRYIQQQHTMDMAPLQVTGGPQKVVYFFQKLNFSPLFIYFKQINRHRNSNECRPAVRETALLLLAVRICIANRQPWSWNSHQTHMVSFVFLVLLYKKFLFSRFFRFLFFLVIY
jgi:hypothetical protein